MSILFKNKFYPAIFNHNILKIRNMKYGFKFKFSIL